MKLSSSIRQLFQPRSGKSMSLQDVSLCSDESDVVLVPPPNQSMRNDPDQRLPQVHYQLDFLQNSVDAVRTDVTSLRCTVNQLTDINKQLAKQMNSIDKNISHMNRSYDIAKEEIKACKRKLFISAIVLAAAALLRLNH